MTTSQTASGRQAMRCIPRDIREPFVCVCLHSFKGCLTAMSTVSPQRARCRRALRRLGSRHVLGARAVRAVRRPRGPGGGALGGRPRGRARRPGPRGVRLRHAGQPPDGLAGPGRRPRPSRTSVGVEGRLARVGEGWCLLSGTGQDWIVPLGAVVGVRGASERSVPEVAWSPLDRLGLRCSTAPAGRRRRRGASCTWPTARGTRRTSSASAPTSSRRATGPGRVLLVPYAAVIAVQSRDD